MEMKKLEKHIKFHLDKEDKARESALKLTREVGRLAANSIKQMHQRDFKSAEENMKTGMKILKEAKKILKGFPELYYAGFLHASEKELCEAYVTHSIIKTGEVPQEIIKDFDYKSYLHGLCESVGEVRRYILDEIRKGDTKGAEKYLDTMDDMYFFLLNFQYADAITRSLRRQVDYVRSMVERSRSEVTLAKINMRQ